MSLAISWAFLTGLFGSLHCLGMCGPLAAAIGGASARRPGRKMAEFLAGKLCSYAGLGALAGSLGAAFGSEGAGGPRVLGAVAVLSGTLMIWLGLDGMRGPMGHRPGARPSAAGVVMAHLLRTGGRAAPFLAGALAGLLPCGPVQAMLAQGVALGSAWGGAGVMLAFGAGTSPALAAAGLLGGRVTGRWRRTGETLAALAVIAMGALAIARGLAALSAAPGVPAGCCHCGG